MQDKLSVRKREFKFLNRGSHNVEVRGWNTMREVVKTSIWEVTRSLKVS